MHRPMCGAFGSIAIRPWLEIRLENRHQYELERALHHSVRASGDRQDANLSSVLRYLTPPQLPDAANRFQLESYWLDRWDGRRIRMMMDAAAQWGHENNVPLICNEFGAYRSFSDPVSRANWIHDVRTALEADGIGWTMWDYRGGFGAGTTQDGQTG